MVFSIVMARTRNVQHLKASKPQNGEKDGSHFFFRRTTSLGCQWSLECALAFGSARSVGSGQEEPATRRLVRGRQPAAAAAPIAVDARGARVATSSRISSWQSACHRPPSSAARTRRRSPAPVGGARVSRVSAAAVCADGGQRCAVPGVGAVCRSAGARRGAD